MHTSYYLKRGYPRFKFFLTIFIHKISNDRINNVMRIHFIGCLGVSMNILMRICKREGIIVTGSDEDICGHDESNVIGADLVVYSLAINDNNPELSYARKNGIKTISRAEFLGELSKKYECVIAISGTHGKTTTTAMLWEIFSNLNPTVHIGGEYKGQKGQIGSKAIFITEACEYKQAFLHLRPNISVILNTQLDHVDCYKSQQELDLAYNTFDKNSNICIRDLCLYNDMQKTSGLSKPNININNDTNTYNDLVSTDKTNILSKYYGCNLNSNNGKYSFDFCKSGNVLGRIKLNCYGLHNAYNALYAAAIAHTYGLEFGQIKNGIENFSGVSRRFEYLGKFFSKDIYLDYAHHPDEIKATLKALREMKYKKITVVFEPHTYSRTITFINEFNDALSEANKTIITPVFSARETGNNDCAKLLAKKISNHIDCRYLDKKMDIINEIKTDTSEVIIFMGAGKIDILARDIIKVYKY